jgi:hypothetical protein
MNRPRIASTAWLALAVLTGCESPIDEPARTNEAPTVVISGGPPAGGNGDYHVRFYWFGSDPDGFVRFFRYAVDDTTSWVETTHASEVITVSANEAYHGGADELAWGERYHTLFVRAVDDDGLASSTATRSFNAATIVPTVEITTPVGEDDLGVAPVGTTFTVRWKGRDDDGTDPFRRPLGYQLKLIAVDSFSEDSIRAGLFHSVPPTGWSAHRMVNLLIPDSLRVPEPRDGDTPFPPLPLGAYYETDWWPHVDALVRDEHFDFEDLAPGSYTIAIRALDEAGATPPNDLLRFTAGFATRSSIGSLLNVSVADIPTRLLIRFSDGRVFVGPWDVASVEVLAGDTFERSWECDASMYGETGGQTRFAFDLACEDCEAADGIGGWSPWKDNPNHFAFAFDRDASGQHELHIEARDRLDRRSRGVFRIYVVVPSFSRPALWIDDFKMSGVDDCAHDAIIEPILRYAIEPQLGDGETLESFSRVRIGACGESAVPSDLSLAVMSRYRLLYWNVGSAGSGTTLGAVTDPAPSAPEGKYLAIYIRAGGRAIVWGRMDVSALLGDRYDAPFAPELPGVPNPNFGPGTFLWDILHLRTTFDRVGRGVDPPLSPACSGIIGIEATPRAILEGYPAGVLDPSGYDDSRVALWTARWREAGGRRNPQGMIGPEVMIGEPPLHDPAVDTLYTMIPNAWSWERAIENPEYDASDPDCETHPERLQCQEWLSDVAEACGTAGGSPFDGEPVITRTIDPASGGRVVWIGTPLYVFVDGADDSDGMQRLGALMRRLTDWVMEETP